MTTQTARRRSNSLDEAYENNDVDYQLDFAIGLIEDTLLTLNQVVEDIQSNKVGSALQSLALSQKRLADFAVDAHINHGEAS